MGDGHSEPDNGRLLRLRSDALDWLEVDDEVVVLDSEREMYLATNPAGALLWRELSTGATRERLIRVLADTFRIDEETATRDTDSYLAALRQRGLLDD